MGMDRVRTTDGIIRRPWHASRLSPGSKASPIPLGPLLLFTEAHFGTSPSFRNPSRSASIPRVSRPVCQRLQISKTGPTAPMSTAPGLIVLVTPESATGARPTRLTCRTTRPSCAHLPFRVSNFMGPFDVSPSSLALSPSLAPLLFPSLSPCASHRS